MTKNIRKKLSRLRQKRTKCLYCCRTLLWLYGRTRAHWTIDNYFCE